MRPELILLLLVFLAAGAWGASARGATAFVVPSRGGEPTTTTSFGKRRRNLDPAVLPRLLRLQAAGDDNDGNYKSQSSSNNNPLDFILNPYESKIPKEVEADIYRAEANTSAAQNRGNRIALYVTVAVVGVMAAFFNAFLTELRSTDDLQPDMEAFELAESAFAWVLSNALTQFLFLNKIGGGIMLLVGAGSGLLAEAEWDSRRINAERIWEELQRRRSEAERKSNKKKAKTSTAGSPSQATGGSKPSMGKKKAKRLSALSEVVVDGSASKNVAPVTSKGLPVDPSPVDSSDEASQTGGKEEGGSGLGILRGIKDMYDKADALAASQALLLNKQLEDAGVLEKITDETGLKVVGRKEVQKTTSANEAGDQGNAPASAEETSVQKDE
jgi:hypothetical protein